MNPNTPASQLSDELADYQRRLDDAILEAKSLVDGLSDAQFNWNPRPGGWSIRENLDHLNVIAQVYLGKLPARIEEAQRSGPKGAHPAQRGVLGALFLWALEPPGRWIRVKAPKAFQPGAPRSVDEIMTEHAEIRRKLAAAIRQADGLDLWLNKMPLPTVPAVRLSLGEVFAVLLAHERRHLWQAGRVRADAAFPR